jgi:meso-butanediol dehydrogenase/(S,S)-butanediol dehydrogenase/diacetyl reductase
MGKFSNQVVFITGGSSGIGAETSRHFIDEGAQVFVADIEERDIVQSLGSKNAHFMRCDVSNSTSCEEAIAACIQQYGRLDILFANAGMLQPSKSVVEQSIEVFHRVMETNLYSLFYLARSAIPQMQKQGKGVILATASTSGLGGDWGNAPYCASKAAVINLCRVLAIDHADEGIRVNALCPGFVSEFVLDQYYAMPIASFY